MKHGRSVAAAGLTAASMLSLAGCGPASPAAPARAAASPALRRPDGLAALPHAQGAVGASRYGRLAVVGSADAQTVTLGGKPVLTGAAVEAQGLGLDSAFAAGSHDLVLVELDGAAACPVRYVVLDVSATDAARASAPFGTCTGSPRTRLSGASLVIELPGWRGTGDPIPPTRYTYSDGGVRETTMAGEPPSRGTAEADEGPPSSRPSLRWIGPEGCRPYAGPTPPDPGSQVEADALAKDFEITFPKALADPAQVERADLAPERLDRLARCLAALSSWPGSDGFVPDQAAALFGSRRYGRRAFAALDRLAASTREDAKLRAAAVTFGAQMKDYGPTRGL